MLEIGQVLVNRGHNVTYITRSDQVHLVNSFPQIPAVSVGDPVYKGIDIGDIARNISFFDIVKVVRRSLNNAYADEMRYYQHSMETRPDFFICDAFDDPCIDIAVEWKKPFAITCTGVLHQDMTVPYMNNLGTTHHATSEYMTLWERFYHKYVDKINIIYNLYPELRRLDRIRSSLGIQTLGLNRFKQWESAIKLVNTYFGFMPAQIKSPLTHDVGPILSTRQKKLNTEEQAYLESHQRVIYVAWGSFVVLDKQALEAILSAILDQMELGLVDGVIWSRFKKQVALYESQSENLEWTITTRNSVYNLSAPLLEHDMFNDFLTPDWASQFSILAHPSTILFITQGGAESTNEATYHGVPLLMFPYYGDTKIIGRRMELAGVARVLQRDECSFESVRKDLNDLLLDVNGTFADNARRLQIQARIGAKRKSLAADLIGKKHVTITALLTSFLCRRAHVYFN